MVGFRDGAKTAWIKTYVRLPGVDFLVFDYQLII